uniref:Uncharacterized protein n=1 Tax=Avena sativa TaxID=4498 RepID=A0ACD5ULB1_AVESA
MPRVANPVTRTYHSLQGRWDVIKATCSRWSEVLEQIRANPPSGVSIDQYESLAIKKYKMMATSKGKPFVLQHCWKLLEHMEKWKLRDQETKPKKGALLHLDDSDDEGGRNGGRPGGAKKAKEWIKIEREVMNMASKIDEMVKSKETITMKTLEAKMIMKEEKKKNEMKQARWQSVRDLEERKIALEEQKANAEILAEENRIMMMDPSLMDAITKEWWNIRRAEIIVRRKQVMEDAAASMHGSSSVTAKA